jgi:hypothetical protein
VIAKRIRSYKTPANFLAGWMFADLLLALSVIFLATISFQSENFVSISQDTSTGQEGNPKNVISFDTDRESLNSIKSDSGLPQSGLTLEYSVFDSTAINSDIDQYLLRTYGSLEFEVVYIQAIGGYRATEEPSDRGSLAAIEFVIELRKSEVSYMRRASIDISTSPNIESGNVLLRLVFVKKV